VRKSLRKKLDARKQRTAERIDKANWNGQSPMIEIPAQILSRGRRLIDRLLTWTPSLETVFCLPESVSQPLLE